jgi:hypothetical protein
VKKLIAVPLLFTLAACFTVLPTTSTATPTLTFTAIPTLTATLTATITSLPPRQTPDVISGLLPKGQPVSEWNGIPVMPGAIAGEGDAEGYVFTIKATPQQVQEYYELKLGKLGWQPFAQGDGNSSTMLMFMNSASETLTVSIISEADEVLVLLVK